MNQLGNVIKCQISSSGNTVLEHSFNCHSLIQFSEKKEERNKNKGGYRRKSCEGERFGMNGAKIKQFNTLFPKFQTQEDLRLQEELMLCKLQERLVKKKSHRKHKHQKENHLQTKGQRTTPFQAWDQNRTHKLQIPCYNKISIQNPIHRRLQMKQPQNENTTPIILTDLNKNSDFQLPCSNHNKNISIPTIQIQGLSHGKERYKNEQQKRNRNVKIDSQSYFQSQLENEDLSSYSSESESSQNSLEYINQAPIFNISFYRAQQLESTKQQYRLNQNKTINKFVDEQAKVENRVKQNIKLQTLTSVNSKLTFYQPNLRNKTQSQLVPLMSNTGKSFFTSRNENYKTQSHLNNPYSRQETERWISQQLPQPEVQRNIHPLQKKHSVHTIKAQNLQDKENNFKTIFNETKPKEQRSTSNFISSRKIFIL